MILEEKKKGKWYFSCPVLVVTFILFWPVSLVLTIMRFRKRAGQEGKYKTRSKIALGVELAIITISILISAVTSYKDLSWKKQFNQYIQEENFTAANEVLAENSKTNVYKKNMEFYLDLWEKSGDYSEADEVIEKYYNTLNDPLYFDEDIENRIQAVENKISPEQKEKVIAILDKVSEARYIKESKAEAEQESKAQEESRKIAEEEARKASEAQAESQSVAEAEARKVSEAQAESQRAAEEEARKVSEAQAESQKAAERKAQEESKAQEKKIAQSQAEEEKNQKEKEAAQTRIEENIKSYMQKEDFKVLKKLQKEDSELVKSALKQKMREAAQTVEQEDGVATIKNYCGLYSNLYGTDDIQNIIEATQELSSLEYKAEILDHVTIAGKTFSLEDAYNMCESNNLYITQRLETKYDDTIDGTVQKELDSLNQPKKSEWVAYDVKYETFGEYPGDNCAVICTSQDAPFPKAGVYYISYIASSETRRLKDSKGFTLTAPVYYMLDDVDDLYTRYAKSEGRRTEIAQTRDRLKLALSMQ